ncbi:glycerophosphodiester phosphodiesterase [Camelimonas abortus]|uniref:glycerophosphodiester phosphodiesterase n=1 Tax=Camelimonas abortus TaxID=1017184 RepID=A0ABV7LAN4_9HYPH
MKRPLVIAHRGASGYLPEHTLAACRLAIDQGADFIEPDLVATSDGVLVVRHEPMLGDTTDVAGRPEFAARRRTLELDGVAVTDWFACDFTFAELRTLRARQAMPWRDQSHNGLHHVPALEEVIALAQRAARKTGRVIGVIPEIKHPSWHAAMGLALEDRLLAALEAAGWRDAAAPVIIQSFETASLRYLRARTGVRLLQLVDGGPLDDDGRMLVSPRNPRPWDWTLAGDRRVWADMLTPEGLREIRGWADCVSPWKRWLVPTRAAGPADGVPAGAGGEGRRVTLPPSGLVRDAHAAGLAVFVWTLRSEPRFLAASYRGDPAAEARDFISLGVDGLFTDFPDVAVRARDGAPAPERGAAS